MREQYISKCGNKFYIRKTVNKKPTYFGTYGSMEEAIKVRDKLIENNWDCEKLHLKIKRYFQKGRYIRTKRNNGKMYYDIVKRIDGKPEYFGTYCSLSEAIKERNILEQNEWDYENICNQ